MTDLSLQKQIAEDFLNDRQKMLMVRSLELSTALEGSRTSADMLYNFQKHAAENKRLIGEMDFSRYGNLGPVMKASLIERLIQAEPIPNAPAMYQKYISPLEQSLRKTTEGQILLASYAARLGNSKEFETRLDHIYAINVANAGTRFNGSDVFFVFASMLAEQQRWDELGKLLDRLDWTRIEDEDADLKIATELRSARAIKDFRDDKPAAFVKLVNERFNDMPCLEQATISQIWLLLEQKKFEGQLSEQTLETLLKSFDRLSTQLSGFKFNNLWGTIAVKAKQYELAKAKFSAALAFEGDHSWALLNWGWAALSANELDLAKAKYQESLAIGTIPIPAAIQGLLHTLAAQDDIVGYYRAFQKYGRALEPSFDHAERSALQIYAMEAACRSGKRLDVSAVSDKEGILIGDRLMKRSDFDYLKCKFEL